MSNSINKLLFKFAFILFILFINLILLKNLEYLFKSSSSKFNLELKFDESLIPPSKFNFISPSDILRSSKSPKIFLIKMSLLSAKKLKFAFEKFKPLSNSILRSFTFPLAMKSFKSPCSVKNISISDTNFPFLILFLPQ